MRWLFGQFDAGKGMQGGRGRHCGEKYHPKGYPPGRHSNMKSSIGLFVYIHERLRMKAQLGLQESTFIENGVVRSASCFVVHSYCTEYCKNIQEQKR